MNCALHARERHPSGSVLGNQRKDVSRSTHACHEHACCACCAQERPDGTNVNNWHWTERDVMGWSRGRLGELLGGMRLADTAEAGAKVTGVQELEGARVGRAMGSKRGAVHTCFASSLVTSLQTENAQPRHAAVWFQCETVCCASSAQVSRLELFVSKPASLLS